MNEVKFLSKFVNVSTTDIVSSYEIHSSYLQVMINVSKNRLNKHVEHVGSKNTHRSRYSGQWLVSVVDDSRFPLHVYQ